MNHELLAFSGPDAFLREARPFLEAHESRNNLVLGLATRLIEHPDWVSGTPYLAVVKENGEPRLAALMTPSNRLLLGNNPQQPIEDLDETMDVLCSHLLAGGWTVPAVNAENSLAERFAGRWSQLTGSALQKRMRLRIYELRRVTPPHHPPPGVLRPATLDDYETIVRWHYALSTEAFGMGDLEQSRQVTAQRISVGDAFLWDDHGPVSMALRNRPTRHGCTIGGVYTPPGFRRRGYASACVAALSQYLLDSGKQFCNLYTDLANASSNAIYQQIGYYPICDCLEFAFGPG